MAYIEEQSQWDDGIYQLEITDPVGGGPDGIDNRPHKHLANRSLWLKANKADIGGDASLNFKVAAGIANDDAVNLAQLAKKANLGGDTSQRFKVADAIDDDEAVSKALLNSFRRPPIGTISLELIDAPREYQIKALGEEFSRTEYPDLWEFISAQTNLLKSENEWQSENSSNGMCGYYSSGDGSTTFRVPNLLGVTLKGVSSGVGRYEGDENKSHTHTANHNHSASSNSTGNHNHTGSTSDNGSYTLGGAAHDVGYSVTANYTANGNDHLALTRRDLNPSIPNHRHSFSTSSSGAHIHTITVNTQNVTTSSNGASENTVKNIGVLPLIVAK